MTPALSGQRPGIYRLPSSGVPIGVRFTLIAGVPIGVPGRAGGIAGRPISATGILVPGVLL